VTRDRLTRWRLVLGGDDADGIGDGVSLDQADRARDAALEALYDERRGGLGRSSPRVARWLGDIRTFFPSSVVQVMQRDAMDRLGLRQLLLEPELLESVEPDIDLATTLVGLGRIIPEHSKATARAVVRKVTDDLEARLAQSTRAAIIGALDRASRTQRPRHSAIDWRRTIAANLRHYQPEHRTVIPERLIGYAHRSTQIDREIVLCIDQSGSMAESVVFASVFGAVMASLRSVQTRLVAFDTEVVDLSEQLGDPVDVLFGVQLGGGTDINRALAYCQQLIARPADTVVVLISDLFEGGIADEMLTRVRAMVDAGVTFVALLALSDSGAPAYDHDHAAALAGLGVPAFACTPDRFPDLMAAAIQRHDIASWAGAHDIAVAAPTP
jgi:Mg-chelatase subunit ChlD